MGEIAKLDDEARKFLREDLRKNQKRTAAQLCLINDIFAHYENEKSPRSPDRGCSENAKNSKRSLFLSVLIDGRPISLP